MGVWVGEPEIGLGTDRIQRGRERVINAHMKKKKKVKYTDSFLPLFWPYSHTKQLVVGEHAPRTNMLASRDSKHPHIQNLFYLFIYFKSLTPLPPPLMETIRGLENVKLSTAISYYGAFQRLIYFNEMRNFLLVLLLQLEFVNKRSFSISFCPL